MCSKSYYGLYIKLEAPDENSILVYSSVGYLSEKIVLGNQTVTNIYLLGWVKFHAFGGNFSKFEHAKLSKRLTYSL